MFPILLVLVFVVAIAFLLPRARTRRAPQAAAPAPGVATRPAPNPPAPPQGRPVPAAIESGARVRDRYIGARFPGVFRNAADLLETEYVVKVARHLYEEGRIGAAHEVFALAIEESPREIALRLAQLEITFLARDAELYARLARELHEASPALAEWDEVARLGRALAPDESLFNGAPGAEPEERYGPWRGLPNWIGASWDLTPEILSGQFHRAVIRRAGSGMARPATPALGGFL